MMKCMVLFVLLTSLVGASLWSPKNRDQNLINRQGHRVVVVEYDKKGQNGNTKISISPQDQWSTEIRDEKVSIRSGDSNLLGVVHLFGFSMAFGMSVWMMFVSSYILGGALPRQQFGMVQSKLYPNYFKIQSYCVGLVLMTHLLSNWRMVFTSCSEVFYVVSLIVSYLMSLSNVLYWEPRATKIMLKRLKLEKEGGRVSFPLVWGKTNDAGNLREKEAELRSKKAMVSKKLEIMSRKSSYANIVTLMSLTLHMVYLGQQLKSLVSA